MHPDSAFQPKEVVGEPRCDDQRRGIGPFLQVPEHIAPTARNQIVIKDNHAYFALVQYDERPG